MRLLSAGWDTIFRYEVPIIDEFVLELPTGAVPLSVAWQVWNQAPMLWCAVRRDCETYERHRFLLRGTGRPFPNLPAYRFIGTFQIERLALVYHLFDAGPVVEEER